MTRFNFPLVLLAIFQALIMSEVVFAQSSSIDYQYEINTVEMADDRIAVELVVSGFTEDSVTYCFPKIVPGIYGAMDFGQYVTDLEAFDEAGNPLSVERAGVNCWRIKNAGKLASLTYLVDDGWEEFDEKHVQGIYRSASSSFEDHVQVINPNCLFGYFRGYTHNEIEVKVNKAEGLYPATSLEKSVSENQDVFYAESYHELVDNPILYAVADTTHIKLPNIDVEVACYSTSGEFISKPIAEFIRPLLISQSKYLNNQLPVDKYTFIIYHNLNPDMNFSLGDGLEHSNSTLILLYMPLNMEMIKDNVYGIASHEFFHTLMPLGLHSHEIENYDFNDPSFSKHLWLYEGMTEYFTMHMPVKTGLQTEEEFKRKIERKVDEMRSFDADLAMTELSLNPMEMQDQYYNVYLKGALLNLCLDIKLRELSGGEYGVKDMVKDLMEKYGPDQPFDDDKLFDEMAAITGFEEIREFSQKYIEGTEPLPLEEMLLKVGWKLEDGKVRDVKNVSEEQRRMKGWWLE